MQVINKILSISMLVIFSQYAVAKSLTSRLSSGHLMVQVGGYGSLQGKQQHIQQIDMEDMVGDEFILTKNHDGNFLAGIGYFIDGPKYSLMTMSYGINALYLANTSVSGTIIQERLFANLSYAYNINHTPIYAVAKSLLNTASTHYGVTAEIGIGPNFMHTNNYSNQSLDGGMTSPDDAFTGRTTTSFSAMAGVGVRLNQVFGKMPLECGYRFFYLGHGGLLRKSTDQIITTLETGTAYANALICSVII